VYIFYDILCKLRFVDLSFLEAITETSDFLVTDNVNISEVATRNLFNEDSNDKDEDDDDDDDNDDDSSSSDDDSWSKVV